MDGWTVRGGRTNGWSLFPDSDAVKCLYSRSGGSWKDSSIHSSVKCINGENNEWDDSFCAMNFGMIHGRMKNPKGIPSQPHGPLTHPIMSTSQRQRNLSTRSRSSSVASPASTASGGHALNEEEAAKLYAYVQEEVESLAAQLKRGSLHGSTRTGLETLELMTLAVKKGKFLDIRDGLKTLRAIGRRLVQARPIELTVGNVVRRTLFIVRQENASLLRENQIENNQLNQPLTATPTTAHPGSEEVRNTTTEEEGNPNPGPFLSPNSNNRRQLETPLFEQALVELPLSASPSVVSLTSSSRGVSGGPGSPLTTGGGGGADAGGLPPLALTRAQSSFPLSVEDEEELLEEPPDISLSLHKLLDQTEDETADLEKHAFTEDLRDAVLDELDQLRSSIIHAHDDIRRRADQYIHAKERILVFGYSRTVIAFLKEAARFRKFEVIVAESAPSFAGHRMAVELAALKIDTIQITDAALLAVMSLVNKVVVAPHAVLANGGVIAHAGFQNVAVAAQAYSVPVVVVAGLHKLCPLYAFDQDTFNAHRAPSEVLKFEDDFPYERVVVTNPGYTYVEPSLISIFVTNYGGHHPGYVYRLLADRYDPRDYHL